MDRASLQLSQTYQPLTFVERGVAVPFTTPVLHGARARPGQRTGIELIVPNPSGARGSYILPWTGVADMCRPTVHDRRLCERVTELNAISPSSLRRAARFVAAEGLAGREAKAAIQDAEERDRQQTTVTNYLLLMALMQQVETPGSGFAEALAEAALTAEGPIMKEDAEGQPSEIERRAKRALAEVAPTLNSSPEEIADILEQMAEEFGPIGFGMHASGARIPREIIALTSFRNDMYAWSGDHIDNSGPVAAIIAEVAQVTLTCAQTTLADARVPTDDVYQLICAWPQQQDNIKLKLARPEWFLDGWGPICALWQEAEDDGSRRAAIDEIGLLLPVLPKEAAEWTGVAIEGETSGSRRKIIPLNEDWRTGALVFDQIARAERRRALNV